MKVFSTVAVIDNSVIPDPEGSHDMILHISLPQLLNGTCTRIPEIPEDMEVTGVWEGDWVGGGVNPLADICKSVHPHDPPLEHTPLHTPPKAELATVGRTKTRLAGFINLSIR